MLIANGWVKPFNCKNIKIINLKNNWNWKPWLEALRKRRKNQAFKKIIRWKTPWGSKPLIRVKKIIRKSVSSREIIRRII